MSASSPGMIRRFFGTAMRVIDTSRRVVLNLLFLVVLAVILVALFSEHAPQLHARSALVLELKGPIVEQTSGTVSERLRDELQGQFTHEVQLRDILKALNAAAVDPKIERVVLLLDEMEPTGLPVLREVAAALERVKAAGKQVIAWGSSYDQRQYFLAAHAQEIYLHPMGMVYLRGFGGLQSYYKDALDRLGVKVNVFRAGKFKNFGEVFSENAPSEESMQAEAALYDALWNVWTSNVEKARELPAGSIDKQILEAPQRLEAVDGDAARLALEAKWVDGLLTADELRDVLVERGVKDEDLDSFRQISFENYLMRQVPELGGPAVGVVVAQGEISDGDEGPGRIGGRSTAELIRMARDDDSIHAIVLRVDSPGGSAFGSELIRRELELTREAGKPVVVSMGNIAASGGYWISTAADEVIADAATVTGSIGVIAMLPSAQGTMNKLSIHSEGYATTWLAQAYDVRTGIDPRFAAMIQSSIGHTYTQFVNHVAAARNASVEEIDEVAQGRVWAGVQALEHGLVDRLGSYTDALDAAAAHAELGEQYRVKYIEGETSPYARLLELLGASSKVKTLLKNIYAHADGFLLSPTASSTALPPLLMRELSRHAGWALTGANDVAAGRKPYVGAVHCFCAAP